MINSIKILNLGKGNNIAILQGSNIAPSAIKPLGQMSNLLGAPDLAAYPDLQGLTENKTRIGPT